MELMLGWPFGISVVVTRQVDTAITIRHDTTSRKETREEETPRVEVRMMVRRIGLHSGHVQGITDEAWGRTKTSCAKLLVLPRCSWEKNVEEAKRWGGMQCHAEREMETALGRESCTSFNVSRPSIGLEEKGGMEPRKGA
jgi:hypothetical protein